MPHNRTDYTTIFAFFQGKTATWQKFSRAAEPCAADRGGFPPYFPQTFAFCHSLWYSQTMLPLAEKAPRSLPPADAKKE